MEVGACPLIRVNEETQRAFSFIGEMSSLSTARNLATRQIGSIDPGLFQVGEFRSADGFAARFDL